MLKSVGCGGLLLACVVLAGSLWGWALARCVCSDVRPRVAHDGPPLEEGCNDQRRFGKCDADFMFNTIEELEAGYCQITCGRCDCCVTVEELALSLGLEELMTAFRMAGMEEDFLTNPGWMTSILAPPDGALSSWLAAKGWTWASVKANSTQRNEMEEMLSLHILPPAQPMDSVWTTPFFYDGVVVPSLAPEHDLLAGLNLTIGRATLTGPVNTVTILEGDKEFCKGFIHTIDHLLLLEVPEPGQPITSTQTIKEIQAPATEAATNSRAGEGVILREDPYPAALESPGPEITTLPATASPFGEVSRSVLRPSGAFTREELPVPNEPSEELLGDAEAVVSKPPSLKLLNRRPANRGGSDPQRTPARPERKSRISGTGGSIEGSGPRTSEIEAAPGDKSKLKGGTTQSQSQLNSLSAGLGNGPGSEGRSNPGQGAEVGSGKPTNASRTSSEKFQRGGLSEAEGSTSSASSTSKVTPKINAAQGANRGSNHLG